MTGRAKKERVRKGFSGMAPRSELDVRECLLDRRRESNSGDREPLTGRFVISAAVLEDENNGLLLKLNRH